MLIDECNVPIELDGKALLAMSIYESRGSLTLRGDPVHP